MKRIISFNELTYPADLGDSVVLQGGTAHPVVKCEETDVLMINVDANELVEGDLSFLKALGLTISRSDTDRPIAIQAEENAEGTTAAAVAAYLALAEKRREEEEVARQRRREREEEEETEERQRREDQDDDSSFFSGGSFGGGSGFGGFGGGSFGGGGASGSF